MYTKTPRNEYGEWVKQSKTPDAIVLATTGVVALVTGVLAKMLADWIRQRGKEMKGGGV